MVNALNKGLNKPDQISQGIFAQAGSFTASGAIASISFPSAFDDVPSVVATLAQSGAAGNIPKVSGTVTTTTVSFVVASGSAYNWHGIANP